MAHISVILPVYNEAGTIAKTVLDFYEKVIRRLPDAELIIAEDGSRDGTKQALENLRAKVPFRLVSGDERKGYTRAFKDALAIPSGPWVFFSDSDGQHDPGDLLRLYAEAPSCDIVSGHKSPRHDPLIRLVLSRVYNGLINILFGTRFKDVNSGFKVIRREVIDRVLPQVRDLRHCVMSEFVLRAHREGFRILEVPVRHYPREQGGSSLFNWKTLPSIITGLVFALARLRWRWLVSR